MRQSDAPTGEEITQALDAGSRRAATVILGMPRERAICAAREWRELTAAAAEQVRVELARRGILVPPTGRPLG